MPTRSPTNYPFIDDARRSSVAPRSQPGFIYPSPERTPTRSRATPSIYPRMDNFRFSPTNPNFGASPPSTPVRTSGQVDSHPSGNSRRKILTAKESGNQAAETPSLCDVGSNAHANHGSQLATPPITPLKPQPRRKKVDLLEEFETAQLSTPSPPTKAKTAQGPPSVEAEEVPNIFQLGAKPKRKSAIGAKVKFEPTTGDISMTSKLASKSANAKPIPLLIPQTTPSRPARAGSTLTEPKQPRKSTTAPDSISTAGTNVDTLARMINARSTPMRPIGLCSVDSPAWDDKDEERPPEFFHELPKELPAFVSWACVGLFANGHTLRYFQAEDLQRMLARELGEECKVPSLGYLLAYDMGYGKTVTTIALILSNPPPKDFQGARATLVVVPNQGVMDHWVKEIKKFAPQLDVCEYRSIKHRLRPNADVVLVTYHQLLNQHRNYLAYLQKKDTPEGEALMQLAPIYFELWYRTAPDEAHRFRNPERKTAQCIWALRKKHAVCITGTPVQNTHLDLYPIFRFLGVTYEGVDDLATYQRKIYSKKQKGRVVDPEAQRLLDTIMEETCIIRKKIDPLSGRPLVDLPPRNDFQRMVTLTDGERRIYDLIREWKLPILAELIRRRQACDHPVLLLESLKKAILDEEDRDDDDLDVTKLIESRHSLPHRLVRWPENLRAMFKPTFLSSKLREMLKIIKTRKPGEKTIIFTHFISWLPAITQALAGANIAWAEYTGDLSRSGREAALNRIATDDTCTVIIVSIKAGGVGLSISSCNTVILLEPWWNPVVEEQAIARSHRIGQDRPVEVYRLVSEDTIEESIVNDASQTQKQKRDMIGNLHEPFPTMTPLDAATKKAWLNGP